jgi:hypothetical protein
MIAAQTQNALSAKSRIENFFRAVIIIYRYNGSAEGKVPA